VKSVIYIVIPTKGRCGRVKTLNWLMNVVEKGRSLGCFFDIALVVEPGELSEYRKCYGSTKCNIVSLEENNKGLTYARHFITGLYKNKKVFHLDDDINSILIREGSSVDEEGKRKVKLRKATSEEIVEMFQVLSAKLSEDLVGVVTISFSGSNWFYEEQWKEPARCWCLFGLDNGKLRSKGINFDLNCKLRQDYDIVAQILSKGLRSISLYDYAFDCEEMGTNGGGCQTYRSDSLNEENVKYLLQKWPGKVKPTLRKNTLEAQFVWSKFVGVRLPKPLLF
jgi:hypothetical protein